MEKLAKERLLKLAERLSEMKTDIDEEIIEVWIEWPENNFSVWYAVKYKPSYFKKLPVWFNEWSFSEHFQEPELIGHQDLGFAGSCMKFFGIEPKEFSHLFDMDGHQNIEMFGGEYLNKQSSPKIIALNIRALLKKRP